MSSRQLLVLQGVDQSERGGQWARESPHTVQPIIILQQNELPRYTTAKYRLGQEVWEQVEGRGETGDRDVSNNKILLIKFSTAVNKNKLRRQTTTLQHVLNTYKFFGERKK